MISNNEHDARLLISVVVPVYFNAASLPELLRRLALASVGMPSFDFEFVFVDDGSGDDSFAVIESLCDMDVRVRAARLSRTFGSNAEPLAGLPYAPRGC